MNRATGLMTNSLSSLYLHLQSTRRTFRMGLMPLSHISQVLVQDIYNSFPVFEFPLVTSHFRTMMEVKFNQAEGISLNFGGRRASGQDWYIFALMIDMHMHTHAHTNRTWKQERNSACIYMCAHAHACVCARAGEGDSVCECEKKRQIVTPHSWACSAVLLCQPAVSAPCTFWQTSFWESHRRSCAITVFIIIKATTNTQKKRVVLRRHIQVCLFRLRKVYQGRGENLHTLFPTDVRRPQHNFRRQ